MQTSECLYT